MGSAAHRSRYAGASSHARLVRALERLLFAAAVLALVAGLFASQQQWMPLLFPTTRHVQLQGQFIHIDRLEVERLVRGGLGEHFFDVDLHALKRSLEAMPWVRRARVARTWPQTLRVTIEEHEAAARWGMNALLGTDGTVFTPARINDDGLALLHASQGMELTALERYREARALLAVAGGATVKALGEDRYGSWSLLLDNGVLVKVGDQHWQSRLERFVGAWRDGLHTQAQRIRCVDLRYPNGFAVTWRDRGGDCG